MAPFRVITSLQGRILFCMAPDDALIVSLIHLESIKQNLWLHVKWESLCKVNEMACGCSSHPDIPRKYEWGIVHICHCHLFKATTGVLTKSQQLLIIKVTIDIRVLKVYID